MRFNLCNPVREFKELETVYQNVRTMEEEHCT